MINDDDNDDNDDDDDDDDDNDTDNSVSLEILLRLFHRIVYRTVFYPCVSIVWLQKVHIKLCFVVLKAWVEKQCKLSNLVLLSAGLGQRRSINKQNGGLGYLVFGCPPTPLTLVCLSGQRHGH